MASNGNNSGQARRMNENEVVSRNQALTGVLAALSAREAELTPILPPDVTFSAFHSTINQALRANPDLLDCTPRSLLNACLKAAYDGLRVDGKEAAIVWEMATIKRQGQPDRKEKQARYMPMYQGLVQQVLRGGLVVACEADVIYENDQYKILRGTQSGIYHEPLLTGPRGKPVAVYNIATLASGYKASAFMTAEEVRDVQRMSKSGWNEKDKVSKGVWARWEGEQWKKTVLRRHRKTLPVGRDVVIRDMESREEFPDMDRQTSHPQMSDRSRNPARPTRESIAFQQGTSGASMDFGGGYDDREYHTIDAGQGAGIDAREQQQAAASQTEKREMAGGEEIDRGNPAFEMPSDEVEWGIWGVETEAKIEKAQSSQALNNLWRDIDPILAEAPDAIDERIRGMLTDRLAELASDASSGSGSDDGDESNPAGEGK